ncbi:ATP-binding protein [Geitlerinema sp. CS-897]|nr:ATP-binding protein [Geitlerinema sp. CS-897]
MDISHPDLASRTLPATAFERLHTLVRHTVATDVEPSFVLTETPFAPAFSSQQDPSRTRFVLGVSPSFSALLIGRQTPPHPSPTDPKSPSQADDESMEVGLTFDPETIAAALNPDSSLWADAPLDTEIRERALAALGTNDPRRQSEFTLQLAAVLAETERSPDLSSVCRPVEDALNQQVEQERLLERVTTQTRQCVELPELISSTVEHVRRFLELDRLAVYQFDRVARDTSPTPPPEPSHDWMTYESRTPEKEIPSILCPDSDWSLLSQDRDRYEAGEVLVLDDLSEARGLSGPWRRLLKQGRVRSQLIVPVRVRTRTQEGEELWGLIVAHQCDRPRTWQPREREFLEHIADRFGLAIAQAQLYAELEQQKQTLEQQVDRRTRDLREALVAAQAASQTRTEFLATIGHELKTPLTCIIGMSSTLLRWSFGHLTPKQREYLQTIYNSGEHLMELINDLLDLSQIESGKTVLKVSEFSLSQLGRQMLRMMVDRAAVNGVRLNLDVQLSAKGDRFRADRDRVRQILFNLLSNALKFTATGGQAKLRMSRNAEYAIFEIEDTGIGIPEEQQSLLFQTFRQLESTYTRKYGGMGLGLALTKQLVELHGGSISVESQVGIGSKFTIRLPTQPTHAKSATVPSDGHRRGHLKTTVTPQGQVILVAECEEEATLICDLLTAAGYHAIWMLESSTALEQIEMLKPVAAIVDRRLSGMDGCEFISMLRQLPAMQSLKILLMTETGTPDILEQCLASGANDCLSRPMEPEQLLDKIVGLIAEAR